MYRFQMKIDLFVCLIDFLSIFCVAYSSALTNLVEMSCFPFETIISRQGWNAMQTSPTQNTWLLFAISLSLPGRSHDAADPG